MCARNCQCPCGMPVSIAFKCCRQKKPTAPLSPGATQKRVDPPQILGVMRGFPWRLLTHQGTENQGLVTKRERRELPLCTCLRLPCCRRACKGNLARFLNRLPQSKELPPFLALLFGGGLCSWEGDGGDL